MHLWRRKIQQSRRNGSQDVKQNYTYLFQGSRNIEVAKKVTFTE